MAKFEIYHDASYANTEYDVYLTTCNTKEEMEKFIDKWCANKLGIVADDSEKFKAARHLLEDQILYIEIENINLSKILGKENNVSNKNKNILKVLNSLKKAELKKIEKIEKMIKQPENIECWDECIKDWRPLTDELAEADYPWRVEELRISAMHYYLVKLDTGIRIINERQYSRIFLRKDQILYQGSLQACKDFVKI